MQFQTQESITSYEDKPKTENALCILQELLNFKTLHQCGVENTIGINSGKYKIHSNTLEQLKNLDDIIPKISDTELAYVWNDYFQSEKSQESYIHSAGE